MRTVSLRLVDLERSVIPIGFVDENLHTQVRIDCMKMFEEYPNAIPSLAIEPPKGDAYPAVVTRDGDWVVWDVTKPDVQSVSIGKLQLTFVVGEIEAKSYISKFRVNESILPDGDVPTPIQNWITEANAVLGTISGAVERAETAADNAETAQTAAETAQQGAETAQASAEAAQALAEAARSDAESARDAAQEAQGLAESARDDSQEYASDASDSADRAEQAANNLGYLEMEIVDGHLIYRKTELIETDFYLVNGHLILEVA